MPVVRVDASHKSNLRNGVPSPFYAPLQDCRRGPQNTETAVPTRVVPSALRMHLDDVVVRANDRPGNATVLEIQAKRTARRETKRQIKRTATLISLSRITQRLPPGSCPQVACESHEGLTGSA